MIKINGLNSFTQADWVVEVTKNFNTWIPSKKSVTITSVDVIYQNKQSMKLVLSEPDDTDAYNKLHGSHSILKNGTSRILITKNSERTLVHELAHAFDIDHRFSDSVEFKPFVDEVVQIVNDWYKYHSWYHYLIKPSEIFANMMHVWYANHITHCTPFVPSDESDPTHIIIAKQVYKQMTTEIDEYFTSITQIKRWLV